MKKLFLALTVAFCIILSGCDKIAGETPNFNKGYSFNAEITYNNTTVKTSLTRVSEGVWEGVVSEPFALQGIDIVYDKGKVSLNLSGLSLSFDGDDLTENLALKLMLDTLENAVSGQFTDMNRTKNNIELKGETEGTGYNITFLRSGNIPTEMEMTKKNLKVEFTEVIFTELKPYDTAITEDEIIDNTNY